MILNLKIRFLKNKLNKMIERKAEYEEILKVSQTLDKYINEKMFIMNKPNI